MVGFVVVVFQSFMPGLNSMCCAVLCLVAHSCLTPCDPMHCSLPAPLSMGFSRQEYWSGLPCPPPGDLPNPGIKPASPISPALVGLFFTISATWEAQFNHQFSSVAQLCSTLCDPMNCSMPGLRVHHQLPEFTQTHVY